MSFSEQGDRACHWHTCADFVGLVGGRGTLAEDKISFHGECTVALNLGCLDSSNSASRDDISSVNYFWNLKRVRVSI